MNKGGEVWITWEKMSLSDLTYAPDAYFYAFRRGRNVLYIGIAYYQNVSDEVRRTINRLGLTSYGLQICLGYITGTTYGRITKQLVRDIECALINAFQPPYNVQCTVSYTGRAGLIIHNHGCIKGTVKTVR